MASDRSLATLLRALQNPTGEQDASRLLGSSTTLLTLLSNPRNLSLLAHQILSAPAIWHKPDGLRTAFRVLGVFNSASIQVLNNETLQGQRTYSYGSEGITKEDWVRTVVKGADERSPRWKHLLVLGGLLVGFEGHRRQGLPTSLRRILEAAVVTAANLALEDETETSELALNTTCLVIGHTFDFLSPLERNRLNREKLLPLLTQAIYFSKDGLQWGYFLGAMDADVIQVPGNKFNWPVRSTTHLHIQRISSGPLVSLFGSLSRVVAFCVEHVHNPDLLFKMTEQLSAFTRTLCVQWRQNKLSEVDFTEEAVYLHVEATQTTLPLLWQLLKSTMFSVIIIQSALLGRVIGDARLPATQAPFVAVQTLHALRNMYFISSRLGHNSFSQHIFVYNASIDILSKYHVQAEAFLREVKPSDFGRIPENPNDRCLDLFFLNTAEHFTLVLPPATNETLLIAAATPYIGTGSDARLMEIFEAAHSVMLAVFSTPQNHVIASNHLPLYVDTLFRVFPHNLSSRQFRLAVKTLVRITSPPHRISETQPLLSSILMEMVRTRSETASRELLPTIARHASSNSDPPLTEQAAMVLTLIDSLTSLPFEALEEWLPLTVEAMNQIQGPVMLDQCRHRFWEVLSNGEMDVARAETCLAWWNTLGGKEAVLHGARPEQRGPFMSGALPEESKL